MHRYWSEGFNDMINFNNHNVEWFIFLSILRIVIIGGLVILAIKYFSKDSRSKHKPASDSAVEILKERYAAGEIDEEEYHKKLKVLQK